MRSNKDSTFLYSLRMGFGCLWWIISLTALAWWLGGQRWGKLVLVITILLTFGIIVLYRILTPLYKHRLREIEESRYYCKGSELCHRCNGSGWVQKDMYNEETCPLCNGSGWEDLPRRGSPLLREREAQG